VELLRSFYPHSVMVWEAPIVVTGEPASPELRALVDARMRWVPDHWSRGDSAAG
jgi:hypothetical protein